MSKKPYSAPISEIRIVDPYSLLAGSKGETPSNEADAKRQTFHDYESDSFTDTWPESPFNYSPFKEEQ